MASHGSFSARNSFDLFARTFDEDSEDENERDGVSTVPEQDEEEKCNPVEEKSRFQKLKDSLSKTVIEPLCFIYYMGFGTFYSVWQSSLYFKICYQSFSHEVTNHNATIHSTAIDCNRLSDYPTIEDSVQRQTAMLNILLVVICLPSLFVNILLSAWSDLHGRKLNLMLGVTGVAIYIYGYVIASAIPESSFGYLFAINFVISFTGFHPNMQNSIAMYLTDIITNKKMLTVRMAIAAAMWSLGYVIGGYISGAMLGVVGIPYVMLVGQGFVTLAALYIFVILKQVPPRLRRKSMAIAGGVKKNLSESSLKNNLVRQKRLPSESDPLLVPHLPANHPQPKFSFLNVMTSLLKDVYETATKKRDGHKRRYLLLSIVAFFLFITVDQGTGITLIYVYRRPRTFTPQLTSYFTAVQSFSQMVGSIVTAVTLKALKWHDVSVTIFSMLSAVAMLLTLAFARSNLTIFMSTIAGAASTVGSSSLQAFMCHAAGHEEFGKVLSILGLSYTTAQLIGTGVYNPIYGATLEWWDGFVFVFVAGLVLVAAGCMGYIWLDMRWEEAKEKKRETEKG